ncbi:MAG: hypothetical protein AAFV88_25690, partial [Planctomycetota bacterium]
MPLLPLKRRSLRKFGRTFRPARNTDPKRTQRWTLLQQLESREMLAGDLNFAEHAFIRSLPSATEAEFGALQTNSEG